MCPCSPSCRAPFVLEIVDLDRLADHLVQFVRPLVDLHCILDLLTAPRATNTAALELLMLSFRLCGVLLDLEPVVGC